MESLWAWSEEELLKHLGPSAHSASGVNEKMAPLPPTFLPRHCLSPMMLPSVQDGPTHL